MVVRCAFLPAHAPKVSLSLANPATQSTPSSKTLQHLKHKSRNIRATKTYTVHTTYTKIVAKPVPSRQHVCVHTCMCFGTSHIGVPSRVIPSQNIWNWACACVATCMYTN